VVRSAAYDCPGLNQLRKRWVREREASQPQPLQRPFWIDIVSAKWQPDGPLTGLIDPDKMKRIPGACADVNVMKAKLVYLGDIVQHFNVSV